MHHTCNVMLFDAHIIILKTKTQYMFKYVCMPHQWQSSQLRYLANQAAPNLNYKFLCRAVWALKWMQWRGLEFLHFSVTLANLDWQDRCVINIKCVVVKDTIKKQTFTAKKGSVTWIVIIPSKENQLLSWSSYSLLTHASVINSLMQLQARKCIRVFLKSIPFWNQQWQITLQVNKR